MRPSLPPLPSANTIIPDDQINANNSPAWRGAILQHNIKKLSGDPLYTNGVISGVTLDGFAHIDADIRSMGAEAQRICHDLTDRDYLQRRGQNENGATFCPISEDYTGQGPFHITLSTEASELVFKITGAGQSEDEAIRLGIPLAGIRRRGRSYMEFIEGNSDGDSHPAHKRTFDAERKNNHRSHAIFIAEKLAQQGWCIGENVASLLFELSLYLIVPDKKAAHEARMIGGQVGGDKIRPVAPKI